VAEKRYHRLALFVFNGAEYSITGRRETREGKSNKWRNYYLRRVLLSTNTQTAMRVLVNLNDVRLIAQQLTLSNAANVADAIIARKVRLRHQCRSVRRE
jgi:hypothetical protein